MPMPQQQLAFSVPQCLPALLPVNQQGRICPSLVCLLWEYAAGEQLVQHGSVQYVQQGVEAAAAQLTTSLSYRARSFVVVVGLFALVPCFVVRSLRFLSRGNKAAFCFKQPEGGSFECLDETTNISTYLQVPIQQVLLPSQLLVQQQYISILLHNIRVVFHSQIRK